MDYKALIPKIKSVRNYKQTTVSPEILKELKNFDNKGKKLIKNIDIHVYIKDKEEVFEQLKGIAGYKNYMLEAPHYIIILSDKKDNYIENTGYIGEGLRLKALELGVNSCWITFEDGEEIKKSLMIDSDKKLTALIALGYDDNKIKVFNAAADMGYNPSKAEINKVEDNISYRLGVEDVVFMKEWGNCAAADDLSYRGLLDGFNYARLAPSTLNRQPWRFILDDNLVILAMRKDDGINEYEGRIDTGIVMLYFESIVDSTLFDIEWIIGKPDKRFDIPNDYTIVGYSNI